MTAEELAKDFEVLWQHIRELEGALVALQQQLGRIQGDLIQERKK